MKFNIRIAAAAMALGIAPLCAPPAASAAKPPATAKHAAPNPLGLTAAQKAKLESIQKKAQAEITAIQKGKGTDKQKQTKILALIKKYDAQEGAVLTVAQRKKIADANATRKRRADETAAVAKLTPAQNKKIAAYRATFTKSVDALAADKKMTDTQKRAKFIKLRANFDKQVGSVLTATQKARMKKIK